MNFFNFPYTILFNDKKAQFQTGLKTSFVNFKKNLKAHQSSYQANYDDECVSKFKNSKGRRIF